MNSFNRHCAILDVTLRDGGYINEWSFAADQIIAIIKAIASASVDFIEVGYLNDNQTLGLAACNPPDLLAAIGHLGQKPPIAAMLRPNENYQSILKRRIGLVDLVRIPCDISQLPQGRAIAEFAILDGFSVAINLTSVSAYPLTDVRAALHQLLNNDPPLHSIYLADSRGALTPEQVGDLIDIAREAGDVPVGFHGHDNLGLAIANSLAAAAHGASFVDGSVGGLGLGGGNADLAGLLRAMNRPTSLESLDDLGIILTRNEHLRPMYILSGEKNLEQEWVAPLLAKYGSDTAEFLFHLPRRLYRSLDEVFASQGA